VSYTYVMQNTFNVAFIIFLKIICYVDEPGAAVILSTIVYNWETFVVTWKTDREDYLYETQYTAWFSTR